MVVSREYSLHQLCHSSLSELVCLPVITSAITHTPHSPPSASLSPWQLLAGIKSERQWTNESIGAENDMMLQVWEDRNLIGFSFTLWGWLKGKTVNKEQLRRAWKEGWSRLNVPRMQRRKPGERFRCVLLIQANTEGWITEWAVLGNTEERQSLPTAL